MCVAKVLLVILVMIVQLATATEKLIINVADAPVGKPMITEAEAARLPTTFDARRYWPHCSRVLSYVTNQGSCGACWAVVVTDSASDRLCIGSSGKVKVRLSAWHLVTCCGVGECADGIDDLGGCAGGDPWGAYRYFVQRGIVSEQCKPFPEWARWYGVSVLPPEVVCEHRCASWWRSYQRSLYYGETYYRLPNDEATIRREILDHGPVVAAISMANPKLSTLYHDGESIYTCYGDDKASHGVKLIGWGTKDGTPYWLAMNSWGDQWGSEGTFKIFRGNNSCHVEEYVSAVVPKL